jgi:Na+-translocating ferredoxin:NAD+ oxidoreductase RnfE subunit
VVADADVWEEDFAAKLVQALTVRDLLARGTDRTLRTVGLGELREILHEAIIR